MNSILIAVLISLILINQIKCDNINSTKISVKLLHLVQDNPDNAYQLNTRSTFTNKLLKSWMYEAEKELNLLFHILISNVSSINTNLKSSIFFTTHQSECMHTSVNKSSIKATTTDIYAIKFQNIDNTLSISNINTYNNRLKNESSLMSFMLIGEVKGIKFEHSSDTYYPCLQFNMQNESVEAEKWYNHQGITNHYLSIMTTKELLPLYAVIVFYLVLLSLSAMFSGLNLGLMSLDLSELKLLIKSGTKKEKYYAKKIYPLRKRGNFLLCTILLGNVLVNSTSTLILGSYLDGIFAAMGSTMFIVIFGEIIPQAVCSRYGLAVGTYTRYVTYFFMLLTSPMSFTLGLILDRVLGKEIASTYSRDKVREMMKEANLGDKEKKFISGALDFKNKRAGDAMMHIKDVFKLDINTLLDFETFRIIADHGYSRIPIYEHTR